MRLYELTDAYAGLAAQLEDCETEQERADILAQMDAVGASIGQKADAYARIMRNAKLEAEAYDAEIKRMTAKKRARENTVERIKERVHYAMELAGATEISTSIGKWRIRQNDWSVNVTDLSRVPERFLIKQPARVDKDAMRREFKQSGEIFDGVEFVRTEGVQFR